MSTLPPLDAGTVLRLSREGGVAAMPGLRRERQVALDGFDPAQRQRLHALLETCAARTLPRARAGAGDRRYFAIAWDGPDEPLRIAEDEAPAELVRLWRDGALD